MLRLVAEGEGFNIPRPQEDDGSVDFVPSTPSLTIWSSTLGASEIDRLRQQLQSELATALIQSTMGTYSSPQYELQSEHRGNVDLRHLPLPRSERQRLEDDLSARLAQLLAERPVEPGSGGSSALASTCVATSPGDFTGLAPVRDALAAPPPGLDPNLPMTFAVYSPSGDVLLLEVFPWPAPVLPLNDVKVGLASAVDWAKQIVAWTVCPPHYHQFVRVDGKGGATWMTVSRTDNLNAVVFRKPKIFGIWFDIFYFEIPEFIDVLGGRHARFTWLYD